MSNANTNNSDLSFDENMDETLESISDTESIGSIGSIDSIDSIAAPIYEEFDKLIEQCNQINNTINSSFEALQNIYKRVENRNCIFVEYNGEIVDFDVLLEQLHTEALQHIELTGETNFAQKLLEVLKTIKFL